MPEKPTRRIYRCPNCLRPMVEFPMFSSIRLICEWEKCLLEIDKRDYVSAHAIRNKHRLK